MSQALRNAIGQRLAGSIALDALVARDPNDPSAGALFASHKNDAPAVYPCVTYRLQTDTPDKRFRSPRPGVDTVRKATDVVVEIEAWAQGASCAPIENIQAQLDALFHDQAFDLPGGAGRVLSSWRTMGQADLYDKKNNTSFGLFLYRLRLSGPAS